MRVRSTLTAVVVVGLALLLGATSVIAVLHRTLDASASSSAKADALDIASFVTTRGKVPARLPLASEELASQIVNREGRVVTSTKNIAGQAPMVRLMPAPGQVRTRSGVVLRLRRYTSVGLDLDYRYDVAVVGLPASIGGAVLVADSLGAADHAVDDVLLAFGIVLPLLIIIVGVLVWMFAGWALRPVEMIRAEVAGLSASDLRERVVEPDVDDEIGRLAKTMNALLARLERSSNRQRQLVADVSHELRNPLAALRAQLEVAGAHVAGLDSALLDGAIMEVDRLSQLVSDLLTLARMDESALIGQMSEVDLDELALAHAERLRSTGRVEVSVREVSAARVLGDPAQLTRVVGNLADNAERHASRTVKFAVTRLGGVCRLSITDDGPGIAVEDRSRIFERFVRLDSTRAEPSAGAGLGLAIVREIIDAHGGSVWVEDGEPGARFIVQLPILDAEVPTRVHVDPEPSLTTAFSSGPAALSPGQSGPGQTEQAESRPGERSSDQSEATLSS